MQNKDSHFPIYNFRILLFVQTVMSGYGPTLRRQQSNCFIGTGTVIEHIEN